MLLNVITYLFDFYSKKQRFVVFTQFDVIEIVHRIRISRKYKRHVIKLSSSDDVTCKIYQLSLCNNRASFSLSECCNDSPHFEVSLC